VILRVSETVRGSGSGALCVEDVQRMSQNSTPSSCQAADRNKNGIAGRHAAPLASIRRLGFGRCVLCYRPFAACDTSVAKLLLQTRQTLRRATAHLTLQGMSHAAIMSVVGVARAVPLWRRLIRKDSTLISATLRLDSQDSSALLGTTLCCSGVGFAFNAV
jgi:hypothetical protein